MTSLFVSVDGPKGVGKTTLIQALVARLEMRTPVFAFAERDLDPMRSATSAFLDEHRGHASREIELEIARRLADGRAHISRHTLATRSEAVIVADRWYPSDAAFRLHADLDEVIAINRERTVREPGLVIAAACDASVSWERARSRQRGLDSRVIHSFDEHARSTDAFARAAARLGWHALDTSAPIDALVETTSSVILDCLG
jgi:thymidylate kinase